MKTIAYSVQPDKVVVTVDNQTQHSFPYEQNWVVSVVTEMLYKLHIKQNKCMLEIMQPSPDCAWNWKQRVLVYINSMYSFMWTMETPNDLHNAWGLFDKIFSEIGYVVERS